MRAAASKLVTLVLTSNRFALRTTSIGALMMGVAHLAAIVRAKGIVILSARSFSSYCHVALARKHESP